MYPTVVRENKSVSSNQWYLLSDGRKESLFAISQNKIQESRFTGYLCFCFYLFSVRKAHGYN